MSKLLQATPFLAATLILYGPSISTAADDILNLQPILLEAGAAAQAIPEADARNSTLRAVAQAQISAHNPEAALETLNNCQECSHKSGLFVLIAGELAAAGHMEQALELVNVIKLGRTKTEIPDGPTYIHGDSGATDALSRIAKVQARRGDLAEAQATLTRLPEKHQPREGALIAIGAEQIKRDDWHGAAQTIKPIMGSIWLSEHAWECMLQPVIISSSGSDIHKHIDTIEDAQTRMFALAGLARLQLSRHDLVGALETAKNIRPGYARASAFKSLAEASMVVGDRTIALEHFQEAVASAKVISGNIARADTLWRIASAQAVAGAIQDALETTRSIELQHHYVAAIRDIAAEEAKAGDIKGTLETLALLKGPDHDGATCNTAYLLSRSGKAEDAVKLVAQDSDHDAASCALSIASGQAEAGDIAGAEATVAALNSIEQRASRVEEVTDLTRLLQTGSTDQDIQRKRTAVLVTQARLDMFADTLAIAHAREGNLSAALAVLDSYQKEPPRATSYENIAQTMATSNYADRALSWARTLSNPEAKSRALLGVARGFNFKREPPRSICDLY